MIDEMDENIIQTVKSIIIKNTGILFDDQHIQDLKRHITSTCKDLQIPISSLHERLQDSSFFQVFLETLLKYITIGETYFFRDKNLFLYLRDILLPEIIRERRKKGNLYLRFWSAACSSGEEPYSLAMITRFLLPDIENWDIYILGTDINENMLDKAAEATYSRWSFRDEPIIQIGQFFKPTPDNKMKIDDSIKKMVRFERMNLIRDTNFFHALGPSSLDLILCRNVLMYFSPNQSSEVVNHLIYSLRIGGFLLVSPQEIGILSNHDIRMIHHNSVFIHVKEDKEKKPISDTVSQSHILSNFEIPVTEPNSKINIPEEPVIIAIPESSHITIYPSSEPIEQFPDFQTFDLLIADNKLEDAGILLTSNISIKKPELQKQIEKLIRAYAGTGDYDPALGWADRMIASDPLNPHAYLLKAAILDEQGLHEDSLHTLRQALYANPDYLPAHLAIAGIYSHIGKIDLAKHHYRLAISILDTKDENTILEETEGIPAGKMRNMISMLLR